MIILHGKRLTVQIEMVPSEGAKGRTEILSKWIFYGVISKLFMHWGGLVTSF